MDSHELSCDFSFYFFLKKTLLRNFFPFLKLCCALHFFRRRPCVSQVERNMCSYQQSHLCCWDCMGESYQRVRAEKREDQSSLWFPPLVPEPTRQVSECFCASVTSVLTGLRPAATLRTTGPPLMLNSICRLSITLLHWVPFCPFPAHPLHQPLLHLLFPQC